MKNIAVIGGGAAGFFAAINCAEKNPDYTITIFEKSNSLLSKVKISGGGRCNVTHACFDAIALSKNYPRGEKQLLGPFTKFNPSNTIEWFKKRGVEIKREEDGRMFPASNISQTIIDCFMAEAKRNHIKICINTGIDEIISRDNTLKIKTSKNELIIVDAILITAGSAIHIWRMLEGLGHKIIPAVPSLFTFNCKDERLLGLEGLAVPKASVTISPNTKNKLTTIGPVLVTHWGLSGPAILRASAWGARVLAEANHRFETQINWTDKEVNEVREKLKQQKVEHAKKTVSSNPMFAIPKRLWERMVQFSLLHEKWNTVNFADLSNKQIDCLANNLAACSFQITGKSTFKEEFVTAGGVDLSEVDFKTMQSKIIPGIYFAGEVLDIDAITGGFNFQAAWTTAWVAANAL